jgi:hypothetical protein
VSGAGYAKEECPLGLKEGDAFGFCAKTRRSSAASLFSLTGWKRPLDQLLRETKSHLDELSDGTVVAVPEGFVLETPEETAAEEAKKAQRIAK